MVRVTNPRQLRYERVGANASLITLSQPMLTVNQHRREPSSSAPSRLGGRARGQAVGPTSMRDYQQKASHDGEVLREHDDLRLLAKVGEERTFASVQGAITVLSNANV